MTFLRCGGKSVNSCRSKKMTLGSPWGEKLIDREAKEKGKRQFLDRGRRTLSMPIKGNNSIGKGRQWKKRRKG